MNCIFIYSNSNFIKEILAEMGSSKLITKNNNKGLNYFLTSLKIKGKLRLLRRKKALFFEFASRELAYVSHLAKKCRIITRLHRHELWNHAPHINWDNIDEIIFVSKYYKKLFLERYDYPEHHCHIIKNAISCDRKKKQQITKNIAIISNRSIKRVYELILLFPKILEEIPGLVLFIVGNYNDFYYTTLKRLITKLALENDVIITGWLDKIPWEQFDIVINHSLSEGQPVSLQEARINSCYVLSHSWGGVEESVPEERIYLTNDELLNKIMVFYQLSEKEQLRLMNEDSLRARKENPSPKEVALALQKIIGGR